jgi:hypothetical protein
MPLLDSWTIVCPPNASNTAPELGTFRICGDVYGDRYQEEGTKVMTSDITHLTECGTKVRDRTGGMYDLGEPLEQSSHLEVQRIYKAINKAKVSA